MLIGIFQTPDGTQDYTATLCGDGTQLCVFLSGVHDKIDNPKNQKYIGTYIIKEFPQVRENVWRGTVTIEEDGRGRRRDASNPARDSTRSACALIFVCRDITLVYGDPKRLRAPPRRARLRPAAIAMKISAAPA